MSSSSRCGCALTLSFIHAPFERVRPAVRVWICSSAIIPSLLCASAQAVVYQSVGSANPTAFGATLQAAGSPAPVTSSGNDGEDYWRLHQDALAGDFGSSYYRGVLQSGDTSDSTGWTLTYRAKLGRAATGFTSYFAVVDDTAHA